MDFYSLIPSTRFLVYFSTEKGRTEKNRKQNETDGLNLEIQYFMALTIKKLLADVCQKGFLCSQGTSAISHDSAKTSITNVI